MSIRRVGRPVPPARGGPTATQHATGATPVSALALPRRPLPARSRIPVPAAPFIVALALALVAGLVAPRSVTPLRPVPVAADATAAGAAIRAAETATSAQVAGSAPTAVPELSRGAAALSAPGTAGLDLAAGWIEPNVGQAGSEVRYIGRAASGTVLLTGDGAATQVHADDGSGSATVRWHVVGASDAITSVAGGAVPGKTNYLAGPDAGRWQTDVAHYGDVTFADVTPGVDVRWRVTDGHDLAYDLMLSPGVDPGGVHLAFDGVEGLEIADNGDLLVHTSAGTQRQSAPVTYQVDGTRHLPVASRFVVDGDQVSFAVGDLDPALPVVIDPTVKVTYGTYVPGFADQAASRRLPSGDLRIALFDSSSSSRFTSPGGGISDSGDPWFDNVDYRSALAEYDLSPGGSLTLRSVTYFPETMGSVAIGPDGELHLVFETSDASFPTTADAFRSTYDDSYGSDIGYLVLDTDQSGADQLVYGTYYGGSITDPYDTWDTGAETYDPTYDSTGALVVDDQGRAYIVGNTDSGNLPVTPDAYEAHGDGQTGWDDGFLAVFDPTLQGADSLVYGTYIAGFYDYDQSAGDVALAPDGTVWVGMVTDGESSGLTTTTNAYQPTRQADYAYYLIQLDLTQAGDAQRRYATFFSGSGTDEYVDDLYLGVDGAGRLYFTTTRTSADLPTPNGYATSTDNYQESYLGVLDTTLSADQQLVYGTRLAQFPKGLAVRPNGLAWFIGEYDDPLWLLDPDRSGAESLVAQLDVGSADMDAIADAGDGTMVVVGSHTLPGVPTDGAYDSTYDSGDGGLLVFRLAPSFPDGATLDVTNVTSSAVTLSWPQAVDDADVTGYRVYDVSGTTGCDGGTLVTELDPSPPTYRVTGLDPDTTYRYRVVGGDADGQWGSSLCADVTTTAGSTPPPTGNATLTAAPQPGGPVDLTWDPADTSITDLASYDVLRTDPGGASQVIGTTDAGTTSYTDHDPAAGIDVTYQVDLHHDDGSTTAHTAPKAVTTLTTTLTATAQGDGIVDLSWPASSATDLAGYRVFRTIGTGAETAIADPDADTTAYEDTGLPAETGVTYRVATRRTGGAVAGFTETRSTATHAVQLDTVTVDAPGIDDHLIERGSPLAITATGDAGRTGTAAVSLRSWRDSGGALLDSPATVTRTVDLTETSPGTYTAETDLTDVEEVRSVHVTLSDDAGHDETGFAPGLPADVAGELDVTVDAPAGSLPGATVYLRDGGHDPGYVLDVPVDGSDVAFTRVRPDTYDLEVLDADGYRLARTSNVTVAGGRRADETIAPRIPATLDLTIADGHGPFPDAYVSIYTADGQDELAGAPVADDGSVPLTDRLYADEPLEIHIQLYDRGAHYRQLTTRAVTLDPGANTLTLAPEPLGSGTLTGHAILEDGSDLAGARVRLVQEIDDRSWTFETTTAGDGTFRLDALAGDGTLTLVNDDENVVTDPIAVTVDESGTDLGDVTVPQLKTATVDLKLYARYADGAWEGPITLDGATAYHYYVRLRTSHDSTFRGANPYHIQIVRPDDPITVCVSGHELELPEACTTVTAGTDLHATAEIRLDQTARFTGSLSDAAGNPLTGPWTAQVHRRSSDGTIQYVSQVQGAGANLSVPVDMAGIYEIAIRASGGASTVVEQSIDGGTTDDLGTVVLRTGTFAGQPGTGLQADETPPARGSVVTLRGAVQSAEAESSAVIHVAIPTGTIPITDGVLLDGEVAPAADVTSGVLRIPLGATTAGATRTFTVPLKVDALADSGKLGTYATVLGAGDWELAGMVVLADGALTVRAPHVVATRDVELAGRAAPGATVTVVDDGVTLGSATAGATGAWKLATTLADRPVPLAHHLEVTSGDHSQRVTVFQDPAYPRLTTLTVSQPGHGHVAIDADGAGPFSFPYVFVPNQPLRIAATITHPELVQSPVAHVGDHVQIPLADDGTGTFVGAADLDWSELGPIRIAYDAGYDPTLYDWYPNVPEAVLKQSLTPGREWEDGATSAAMVTPASTVPSRGDTATGAGALLGTDGTADLNDMLTLVASGGADSVAQDLEPRVVNGMRITGHAWAKRVATPRDEGVLDGVAMTGKGVDWGGSVGDAGVSGWIKSTFDADTVNSQGAAAVTGAMWQALDAASPTVADPLSVNVGGARLHTAGAGSLIEAGVDFSIKAVDAGSTGYSAGQLAAGGSTADAIKGLLDAAASCNGPAGPGLRSATEGLRDRFVLLEGSKLALATAGVMSSWTGIGAIAFGGASLAIGMTADHFFSKQVADVEQQVKDAFDSGRCEPDDGPPPPPGGDGGSDSSNHKDTDLPPIPSDDDPHQCMIPDYISYEIDGVAKTMKIWRPVPCGDGPGGFSPQWALDPSGVVYAGLRSNRVPDAIARVVQGASAGGPWSIWDASPWGQVNPQTTDGAGQYGWDVPSGWWRVDVTADGYAPASSDVVQVPPPHTDMDIELRNLDAPTVNTVSLTGDGAAFDVHFDHLMRTATFGSGTLYVLDGTGRQLSATVAGVDPQPDPGGDNLSRTARITPDTAPTVGDTYTVVVEPGVESYAEIPVAEQIRREITVTANRAPAGANDAYAMVEDDVLSVDAAGVLSNDTDPDGQHLTASLASGPAHGAVTLDADGGFVYRPDTDFAGTDTFTYRANDGWLDGAPATVTITVRGTEDPPAASPDTFDVPGGQRSVGADGVLGNDRDPDGDALSASIVTPPAHGTVTLSGDGSFVYRAAAGYTGSDRFSYLASDGREVSDPAGVTLNVTAAGTGDTGGSGNPGGDTGGSGSPAPPSSLTFSCPDGEVPSGTFGDVPDGDVHGTAVDCLAWWGVTTGDGAGGYRPAEALHRDQMASLLVRVLDRAGVDLPQAPLNAFSDDDRDVHAYAIDQLAALGIAAGTGDGLFRPHERVSRAQFASFLDRTYEAVTGATLPDGADQFTDDDASVHERAINRLVAAGITTGVSADRFDPHGWLRRDQAASFLARLLDVLVRDGHVDPPTAGTAAMVPARAPARADGRWQA